MPYDLPRIPLPTSAGSAALATLPAAIRQQAAFSARLSLAEPVARMGAMIRDVLEGRRSASEFRRDMRDVLADAGYVAPDGTGGSLLDHTSRSRRAVCDARLYKGATLDGHVNLIKRRTVYRAVRSGGGIGWSRHTAASIDAARAFCRIVGEEEYHALLASRTLP